MGMTTTEILQGVHDWTDGKIVYDISAAHLDGQGNPTPYADLTAALGTGGANIPEALRKGGMSVKYAQSSIAGNKYVQYFLTKDEWSASEGDWEKINVGDEISELSATIEGSTTIEFIDITDLISSTETENEYGLTYKNTRIEGTGHKLSATSDNMKVLLLKVSGGDIVKASGLSNQVDAFTNCWCGFSDVVPSKTMTSYVASVCDSSYAKNRSNVDCPEFTVPNGCNWVAFSWNAASYNKPVIYKKQTTHKEGIVDKLGNLGNLETTAKNNLVSAINELVEDKISKTDKLFVSSFQNPYFIGETPISGYDLYGNALSSRWINTDGTSVGTTNAVMTDYIVVPNQFTLTLAKISENIAPNPCRIAFYRSKSEDSFISHEDTTELVNTIVIPSNDCNYIKLSIRYWQTGSGYIENPINYLSSAGYIVLSFNEYMPLIDVKSMQSQLNELVGQVVTNNILTRNKDKNTLLLSAASKGTGDSNTNRKDFQMFIITDTHGDTIGINNAIMATNGFGSIDAIIHCGDIMPSYYKSSEVAAFNALFEKSEKPRFVVIGNHDTGNSESIHMCATQTQLYNSFIAPLVNDGVLSNGEYQSNKCYYYHDFVNTTKGYKIRLIVVNEYDSPDTIAESEYWQAIAYDSTLDGIAANTSYVVGDKVNCGEYNSYSFQCISNVTTGSLHSGIGYPSFTYHKGKRFLSEAQCNWFVNTLLSTPQNYAIIVATHNPFSPVAINQQTMSFAQNISVVGEDIGQYYSGDNDFICASLNAYINGNNSFSHEINYGGSNVYTITANFSTKASGTKFICFLGGHTHKDLVFKHPTYNYYGINPICSNIGISSDVAATSTEGDLKDHFTVVTMDTIDNKVKLVRLGVDVSTDMYERKIESISI